MDVLTSETITNAITNLLRGKGGQLLQLPRNTAQLSAHLV
jgi:hypothetical protein